MTARNFAIGLTLLECGILSAWWFDPTVIWRLGGVASLLVLVSAVACSFFVPALAFVVVVTTSLERRPVLWSLLAYFLAMAFGITSLFLQSALVWQGW